jgi:hypothetical protein
MFEEMATALRDAQPQRHNIPIIQLSPSNMRATATARPAGQKAVTESACG